MRIDEVLQRIQGEFVEMPGLRLTAAQAQRLWGLERDVCDAMLGALRVLEARRLVQPDAYVRDPHERQAGRARLVDEVEIEQLAVKFDRLFKVRDGYTYMVYAFYYYHHYLLPSLLIESALP